MLSLLWGLPYLTLLAALVLVSGCGTTGSKSPPPARPAFSGGPRIVELNLVAMNVAINLGAVPGPDGFAVRVFAVADGQAKPQPITSGTLEVLMFDGPLDEAKLQANQYRHLWSFPAAQLKAYEFTASVGAGYDFTLGWGTDKPTRTMISVVARYLPPQGPPLYSASSAITVSTP